MNWLESLSSKVLAHEAPRLQQQPLLVQIHALSAACDQVATGAPEPTFDTSHGAYRVGWWREDINRVLRLDIDEDGIAHLCLPERGDVWSQPTEGDMLKAVGAFFEGYTPKAPE